MNLLKKLDDFLLDSVFQPASDWISSRFDIGHLKLARIALHISAIMLVIILFSDFMTGQLDLMDIGPVVFLCIIAKEINDSKKLGNGIENPSNVLPIHRLKNIWVRLAILFLTLPLFLISFINPAPLLTSLDLIVFFAYLLVNPMALIGFYLLACRSNPPGLVQHKEISEHMW
jgi:hypothetical protein